MLMLTYLCVYTVSTESPMHLNLPLRDTFSTVFSVCIGSMTLCMNIFSEMTRTLGFVPQKSCLISLV